MLLQGIFGAGAHSDYGMLTLLKTDQHPGLQIWSKGQFVDVPPRDGMFIVNLGDMLERWPSVLQHGCSASAMHPLQEGEGCALAQKLHACGAGMEHFKTALLALQSTSS